MKEQLAKKERTQGRRIPLEEVSKDTGISRVTLTKLINPKYSPTNTDILDKLCDYFECEINELVEFVPDRKKKERVLFLRDIKINKHIVNRQVKAILEEKIRDLSDMPKLILANKSLPYRDGSIQVDFIVKDKEGKYTFFQVRPVLYHGIDIVNIGSLLSFFPEKLNILTYSTQLPKDIKDIFDPRVNVYNMEVLYDDIQRRVVDVRLEKMEISIKDTLEELIAVQQNLCPICGTEFEQGDSVIDYIVPFVDGGKAIPSNLQAVHKMCNYSKGRSNVLEKVLAECAYGDEQLVE